MHKLDHRIRVLIITPMQMRFRDIGTITKTSHIEAESPDATATELISSPGNARRKMRTAKSVKQDRDSIAGNPTVRFVIVKHNAIIIVQVDDMLARVVG